MIELKVPEMKRAMQQVGNTMLGELEGAGFSIAMIVEMGEEGALIEARRFDAKECSTVQVFMESARKRIRERVMGGASVVLVGITVRLDKKVADIPEWKSPEDAKRWLLDPDTFTMPGAAVFGINRRETAAEIYSKASALADKIRDSSGDKLSEALKKVSTYLFSKLPWPRMN